MAAATAEATSVHDAMVAVLNRICDGTGWPVAHVYMAGAEPGDPLVASGAWHIAEPERFAAFRDLTDRTALPAGVGLPGRVAATGRPAWVVDVTADSNFPRGAVCARVGIRGAFSFPSRVASSPSSSASRRSA